VELCIHFPIRLYGVVLVRKITGTTLPLLYYGIGHETDRKNKMKELRIERER
jgi:hypothetical protein